MIRLVVIFGVVMASLAGPADPLESNGRTDALERLVANNTRYLRAGEFDSSLLVLEEFARACPENEKSRVGFLIGETFFFAGRFLEARERYLEAGRYLNSETANDALERLQLFETVRNDTVLMKRLARAIGYLEIGQTGLGLDSLRPLYPTPLGDQAYYFSAIGYRQDNRRELARACLDELGRLHPGHGIHRARLLEAQIIFESGDPKTARSILEEVVIDLPGSIYAVQARALLEEIISDGR